MRPARPRTQDAPEPIARADGVSSAGMGIRLHLDARTRRFRNGRILLGGSPTRLLVLGSSGIQRVDAWLAGTPVGADPREQALARRLLDAGLVHPVADRGTFTNAEVTVVVPVKDDPDGLQRLLAAIGDVADRIVVDDGSAAPIVKAAVRHGVARGPAAARNAGWRRAGTPLVAFLDSDTVPDPAWLDHVLPLFDDPAVAAVAPRIRSLATGPVGGYEAWRSGLDMGPEPSAARPDGRVRYVPSAALVVRRDALVSLGGFEEDLRYGEDVDLVWRLVAAGHTVRYEPVAVVRHEPRTTVTAWLRQRYHYGTSAAALAQRHPGLLHCAHLPRDYAAQCAVAIAGHPLVGAAPAIIAAAVRARRLHRRGIPARAVVDVTVSGQLGLIRQVADALRRVWWPVALPTRRGRALLAAAWLAPVVSALCRGPGPRAALLRVLDDLAYGLGVWAGCARHRTIAPLLPRLGRR